MSITKKVSNRCVFSVSCALLFSCVQPAHSKEFPSFVQIGKTYGTVIGVASITFVVQEIEGSWIKVRLSSLGDGNRRAEGHEEMWLNLDNLSNLVEGGEATPKKKVQRILQESIHLLEQGKVKEFMENYAHPKEMKKMKINEEFIAEFKTKEVIKVLKSVIDTKPIKETRSVVSYELENNKFLNFIHYRDKWYISDKNDKISDDEK